MKKTIRLVWYSSVLHQVGTARHGDQAGQVNCRVRAYVHEDGADPTEEDATREESHILTDADLAARATARGASVWDESDIRAELAEKFGLNIEG